MTARPLLPITPLSPETARRLESLLQGLTPAEALWISGYLANFGSQVPKVTPASDVEARTSPLVILFASETGHTAGLATQAEEMARTHGLPVRRVDLADIKPQEIQDVRYLLFLTSTHGDGDPPAAAIDFFDYLQGRRAPRLEGTKFAVLGLGDSSYERFCQAAKDMDQRLGALGAQRLHPRADCDVDYEEGAHAWLEAVVAAFGREMEAAPTPAPAPSFVSISEAAVRPSYGEGQPFSAILLESLNLNGRGSDKETRHLELSLAGSGMAWEPGDSLAVVGENDPALVEELVSALHLKPEEPVPAGDGDLPLAEALKRYYDITTLTPAFIQRYGEGAQADFLQALAKAGELGSVRDYMAGRQIIDIVTEYPAPGLGGKAFVAMLRRLQPRRYSLASSNAAYPDEAHLTVAAVRYRSHGRERRGVVSSYLAERRRIDDMVPVYVAPNRSFRLPVDTNVPIIMVGAGTGVAPYRAFLQEREVGGATGRNWLFFGDRRFRTDFLYQTEWQRFLKDGLLTRMDVAFSRDLATKVYVQQRLRERAKDIYAWLEEGAYFYVCGDASHMAPDVHGALAEILVQEGNMAAEGAEEYLRRLQQEKRYQRDIY